MGTSSWLATWLDIQFLEEQGIPIWPPLGTGPLPPIRTGADIAQELGNRKLLRYMLPHQIGAFRNGTSQETYTTPTPYAPEETVSWLVLPVATGPRTHALILEPARIPEIRGPLMVAAARGIQYILVRGFPPDAIIVPGTPGARWEIVVT